MGAHRLRLSLIGVLFVALVLSVVAKKADSPFVGWLSFAVFLCALAIWVRWRRVVAEERHARVFDREAKTTDETRTRPDQ